MDDILFLKDADPGSAKLIISNQHRPDLVIRNLNLETIREAAPDLAKAFINHKPDRYKLQFNDVPAASAVCLIRFVYQKEYTLCDALYRKPISLLLHLQVLRLAQVYGIDRLQEQVCAHVSKEAEWPTTIAKPLIDLCDGIRFLYLELRSNEELRKKIARYCLCFYESHDLGHLEDFRQTVYESSLFHQDLCKANFDAEFVDPGAASIVALAVCSHPAHRSRKEYVQLAADFMCKFHTEEYVSREQSRRTIWREPSLESSFVFVEHPERPFVAPGPATATIAKKDDWDPDPFAVLRPGRYIKGEGFENHFERITLQAPRNLGNSHGPAQDEDGIADFSEADETDQQHDEVRVVPQSLPPSTATEHSGIPCRETLVQDNARGVLTLQPVARMSAGQSRASSPDQTEEFEFLEHLS